MAKRVNRADIWDHFKKLSKSQVRCNICEKDLAMSGVATTYNDIQPKPRPHLPLQDSLLSTVPRQQAREDYYSIGKIHYRKSPIICWHKMTSFIVNDEWYRRQKQQTDDSERIVIIAAKLMKFAVRELKCDMDTYPSSSLLKTVDSTLQHNGSHRYWESFLII